MGDKQTHKSCGTTDEVRNSIQSFRFDPFVEGSKDDFKFEEAVKCSYKLKVKGETLRPCKPVEQDKIIVMEP